jgi:endo-1,4-beta-xylanase
MAMMAEELNAKWKTDERNTEPDRLLIEALGMQAHYWTASLRVQDVEAAIKRFIEAGVKVGITELDIPYGSWTNQHSDPLTAEEERNQARLYAELFKIYKKYASHIDRVTFWGKADSQSWRAKGSPLLFNRAFGAKQSFYAVIDPEGFLSGN